MIADRVSRGVALLDQERPGWWREVDVDTLEMGSDTHCLVGQLYGRYQDGVSRLGLDDLGVTDALHGFYSGYLTAVEMVPHSGLTGAWKQVIAARVLAARRVAAGAALLDEKKPDWFTSVDLAKLKVVYQGSCILGQVYGMYPLGMKALGLEAWGDRNETEHGTRGDGQLHGFGVSDETPEEALAFAWREAIGDRLEAAAEDRARVARGAEVLDRKRPGWRDRIDLASFEISSPEDCVLGQVYRGQDPASGWLPPFSTALDDLGIFRMEGEVFLPMTLGFTAPFSDTLQAAWVAEIEKSAARCVRRGATLLDDKRPGWHLRVCLGLLDMHSNDHCVFGQLWGGCLEAWDALGVEAGKREGDQIGMYDTDAASYSELQAQWTAAIATRRDAEAPLSIEGAVHRGLFRYGPGPVPDIDVDFPRVPPAPRGFRQRLAESLISFYVRCFSR